VLSAASRTRSASATIDHKKRCGRDSRDVDACYAVTVANGDPIEEEEEGEEEEEEEQDGSATGAVESAADDVLLINNLDVASLVVRCIVVVLRSAVAVVVDVPGLLDVAGTVVDTDGIEIVVVPALKHGTDDVKFDAGNCPGSMQHDDALKLSSWQPPACRR
jgi:hypothetical protein